MISQYLFSDDSVALRSSFIHKVTNEGLNVSSSHNSQLSVVSAFNDRFIETMCRAPFAVVVYCCSSEFTMRFGGSWCGEWSMVDYRVER